MLDVLGKYVVLTCFAQRKISCFEWSSLLLLAIGCSGELSQYRPSPAAPFLPDAGDLRGRDPPGARRGAAVVQYDAAEHRGAGEGESQAGMPHAPGPARRRAYTTGPSFDARARARVRACTTASVGAPVRQCAVPGCTCACVRVRDAPSDDAPSLSPPPPHSPRGRRWG